MAETAIHHTSWYFEAFKALVNLVCDPRISFALAVLLLVVGACWMKLWRMWVGWTILVLMALGIAWGWQDHHFSGPEMMGKGDNAPIAALLFIFGWALWFSMSLAVNNDRRIAQKLPPEEKETSGQKTWTWPDLVYVEFLSMIICMIILTAWSILLPAPLEEPANPGVTPNPSKAPWYFLGLQEMLVYFDPWHAGVVLPSMIIIGLCAIPYLDTNPKGSGYYTFAERKFAIVTFAFGFLVLWVFMIITGTFLRGPGWNFFGLFEEWNPHRVVPLNNVNLSEYFWITLMHDTLHMGKGVPVVSGLVPWQGVPEVLLVRLPVLIPVAIICGGILLVLALVAEKTWRQYRAGATMQLPFLVCLGVMMAILSAGFGGWLLSLIWDTPGVRNLVQVVLKEFVGIGFLGFWFMVMPLICLKFFRNLQDYYKTAGFIRYSVLIFLLLNMAMLPLKMIGRWALNLKYIVDTPWIKF